MDDKFDRENEYSETRYPRRERATIDGNTRYPVREERRSLRSTQEQTHIPKREDPFREQTRSPKREAPAQEQNSFTEYERRAAARRAEFSREPKESYYEDIRIERPAREELSPREGRSAKENRTRSAAPQRKNNHRKKRHLTGFAKGLIVLIVALIVGLLSFTFMNHLMNPPVEEVELTGETVTVTIPEGAGTEDIARILKENKLIGSVFGFKLTSKLEGFDGTYKQGTYEVDTGLTKRQIMELLQSGKVAANLKITIPEGYSVKQIAEKVAETEICTAEEFISECNNGTFDYDFLKDLPDREYKLEGYLFPDTYFLQESMTAHDIVNAMLARFDKMYTKEYQEAVEKSEYTLDEIVTIASMIEKEIKVEEERPRAAAVIYNRLKDNMSLGIDATVLYAVGKTSGELTQDDLNTDSPYNTRKNQGLPLGPISNPGESSFRAALYPEDNNYLYYVVEAVGKDNHVYCETYDEFLDAKAAYQASAQ
ncbi:endolytic transglycosylase MltG [Anaerotignum sp.]